MVKIPQILSLQFRAIRNDTIIIIIGASAVRGQFDYCFFWLYLLFWILFRGNAKPLAHSTTCTVGECKPLMVSMSERQHGITFSAG